ncbi:hypothetical protein TGDOM2_400680 [Toxoplasma gondii GAB2-2007-GAL-DOM2]|uniref:Uncharacterized protein n=1 Tax=Toxoplasma gondii GAB2-2007-GAL-DOM2 TaxID=1130820 RepID=A0A086JN89_TOXGO|nr:hypothetical protein TGDOM2_400680 [Toxoplasma gondii GAB2-2007-GAL-DOM2]
MTLKVPCPLSTPLYQQLLQEVWSVSGKLQQLEQQVKLLRLERETAARSSCSYTVDGVSLAGGYSESGVDFHSEVQMIKEVLESQREVLLATAQKALELRENTRRMQDYLERRGVKIPVFPEDQEEVAVNAMAVQATQTTGIGSHVAVMELSSLSAFANTLKLFFQVGGSGNTILAAR